MDSNNPIRLSQSDKLHQMVMRSVLDQMQDTPYVLKGGTSLLFTRDLPRHSTDLDFDSAKKLNIEGRVRKGMENAGVDVTSLTNPKDTATVQRFKVHYEDKATNTSNYLKIETSFRERPHKDDIETVNGIQTYTVSKIIDQKLEAAQARSSARDLFDLNHLANTYGDGFSREQIETANELTKDMEGLAARYEEEFRDDPTLQNTTAADAVLEFRSAIEEQQKQRDKAQEPTSPQRTAEQQAKRDVIEAAIERDFRKKVNGDPEKLAAAMEKARISLDRLEASDKGLPNVKIVEKGQRTMEPETSRDGHDIQAPKDKGDMDQER